MKFQIIAKCLAWAVLALPFAALDEHSHHCMLKNGMKVIVKEYHSAPKVAHLVWYKAGSMDEQNGTTGVAHVL